MTEKLSRGCVIGIFALAACLLVAMLVLVGILHRIGWELASRWISS